MKAKVIAGNVFVITDLPMEDVVETLYRDPKAGTIVDAKGNELVAATVDFNEPAPLASYAVTFNCTHDGKAAIQLMLPSKYVEDPTVDVKQVVTEILAYYWDNIEQVCKNIEGAIEAHKVKTATVAEMIEEV